MNAEEYVVERLQNLEKVVDQLKTKCDSYKEQVRSLQDILDIFKGRMDAEYMDTGKGIYLSFDGIWEDSSPSDFKKLENYLKEADLLKEEQ